MSSTARHFERGHVSGLFPVGQPCRTSPEMSLSLKCSGRCWASFMDFVFPM
ncbi:hypothetical protein F2Q70_00015506 [Brassica cretica]|nr:hypothetical protein F2Q70_00015506 [Brassica cretica]